VALASNTAVTSNHVLGLEVVCPMARSPGLGVFVGEMPGTGICGGCVQSARRQPSALHGHHLRPAAPTRRPFEVAACDFSAMEAAGEGRCAWSTAAAVLPAWMEESME